MSEDAPDDNEDMARAHALAETARCCRRSANRPRPARPPPPCRARRTARNDTAADRGFRGGLVPGRALAGSRFSR
ncbi:hypothetical protein ACFWIA_33580 [Streptomyces sp. NPDC127068]|uniref:hypothetical protein n=1 Tax=Streptomyces sp. NPDC127068 TaxID=3347127 RepID=UPI00364DB905